MGTMVKVLAVLFFIWASSVAVFLAASYVCMVVFGLGEFWTSLISIPLCVATPLLVLVAAER